MRYVLSSAILATLIGCGHTNQDIQKLKDEIKALETTLKVSEEKAEYHFRRLSRGFDKEEYLAIRKNITGEPTEAEIAQASEDYYALNKMEAAAWHLKAVDSRNKAEAKRRLLRAVE